MEKRKSTARKAQLKQQLDEISNRFEAAEKSGRLAQGVRQIVSENRAQAKPRSRVG